MLILKSWLLNLTHKGTLLGPINRQVNSTLPPTGTTRWICKCTSPAIVYVDDSTDQKVIAPPRTLLGLRPSLQQASYIRSQRGSYQLQERSLMPYGFTTFPYPIRAASSTTSTKPHDTGFESRPHRCTVMYTPLIFSSTRYCISMVLFEGTGKDTRRRLSNEHWRLEQRHCFIGG